MVKASFEKCSHAMMAGDYRTGAAHLKQAYAYDRSQLLKPITRAYTKWAAKLWLKDQARRLLTRPGSSATEGNDAERRRVIGVMDEYQRVGDLPVSKHRDGWGSSPVLSKSPSRRNPAQVQPAVKETETP